MATTSSLLHTAARRLEGKVALITGGASGIGEYTAKLFSQHGAKVVIVDINEELGHSVRDTIGSSSASYVHCDVTNETQVQKAVDTAITNYGKLDIMFSNAGIIDIPKPRIIDNEKADFDKVMNTNVTGVFLCAKHAARVMIPARSGCIISTASQAGVIAGVASHGYTASKFAVVGITKNIAAELGQFGIRVNCVSPYGCATPLTKTFFQGASDEQIEEAMASFANLKGVIFRKEEVGRAALYLASDDAKYVSGLNLVVDGGFSIVNPSMGRFKYPEA